MNPGSLIELPLRYKPWRTRHLRLVLRDLGGPARQPEGEHRAHLQGAIDWLRYAQDVRDGRSDAGGVAALGAAHLDAERVEPVPDGRLNVGVDRITRPFRNAHGPVPCFFSAHITAASSPGRNGRSVATAPLNVVGYGGMSQTGWLT